MIFPERLRQMRKERGIQQWKLAKMIGSDQGTISLYESGKHEPTIFTLCCLADALKVSTDYLLGRSDRRD